MLRMLLGTSNCAEMDAKSLGGDHAAEGLDNKLLITFSDSKTADSSDNLALSQFLRDVVGNDPVRINPKGRRAYDAKLMAKVMMICNELPNVRDSSGAMDRRYLMLNVPRTVDPADKDDDLLDKLLPELPGILNWALVGRARLLARGKQGIAGEYTGFVQPASGFPLLEQAREEANHVLTYAQDRLAFGEECWFKIDADKLRADYNMWCIKRDLRAYSPGVFGRCIMDAARTLGVTVERVRANDPDRRGGKLPAIYTGVMLAREQ